MRHSIQIFAILVLCLILSNCKTEIHIVPTAKKTNLAVTGPGFRGTLFTNTYPFADLHVSDIDSASRFTPSKEDIENAELLLSQQIKTLNKSRPNQFPDQPLIHKTHRYFRQYVGFRAPNGDKIIHVNFYWDRYSLKERIKGYNDGRLTFEDGYAMVFDGGSRYWQVNINLTVKKVSDLQVNGIV